MAAIVYAFCGGLLLFGVGFLAGLWFAWEMEHAANHPRDDEEFPR